jgi:hypothetical protein
MSDYFNEAGEPYMDAAAMRFEQELDAQSAAERFEESWYDYEEPDVWCKRCGEEGHEAEDCDNEPEDYNEPEDAWLDGSYEE